MTPENPRHDRGFEVSDVSTRRVIVVVGLLVAGLVISLIAAALMQTSAQRSRPDGAGLGPAGIFTAGSRERTSIAQTRAEMERETQSHLDGYGWRDREHGVVRIPVERAMELMVDDAARKEKQP